MTETVPDAGHSITTRKGATFYVREEMRPDCDPARHLTFAQNKQKSH